MKKLFIITMAAGLIACSEKDKEYYLSHPDQAKTKAAQCIKERDQAFLTSDKEKYQKVKQDKECIAAIDAKHELIRLQREKEEQERKAKEQAEIDRMKQELNAKFGQLNWQEFAPQFVNTECAKGYIRENDYACRALKSIYDEKAAQGKTELAKVSFETLLGQEKQYCGRDKRQFSACSIWEQAITEVGKAHFEAMDFVPLSKLREQFCQYDGRSYAACQIWEKVNQEKEKVVIENYVQNYDLLKQDYNQCVNKLREIGDSWKKHKEREAVTDNYPCPQARNARSKLGLRYDNFKTLME